MLSEGFLHRLDELRMQMKHTASGGAGGIRRSKSLGSSVEFSDFREYSPGDDVRRVDWNAYARFDRLFLKLFTEERERLVNIIVDASASMGFGEPQKWSAARMLAEAVCYLSLGAGDRVTLYALSDGAEARSRSFSSKAGYPDAAAFLDGVVPSGRVELNSAVPRLNLPRGRGASVLLSDLLCEDGYERALHSLAYRKQEVCVLHILCEADVSPAYEDAMELEDSESGEKLVIDTDFELLRLYREAAKGFIDEARDKCASVGAAYSMWIPEEPMEERALGLLNTAGLIG